MSNPSPLSLHRPRFAAATGFPENGVGGFGSGMGWNSRNWVTAQSWSMLVPPLPATDHQQSLSLYTTLCGNYINGIETYTGVALHYFKKAWNFRAAYFVFGGTDMRQGPVIPCNPGDYITCKVFLAQTGTFTAQGISNQDWGYQVQAQVVPANPSNLLVSNVYQQNCPDCQWWVNGLLDWNATGPGSVMACSDYPAGNFGVTAYVISWLHGDEVKVMNWTPRDYFNADNCSRQQTVVSNSISNGNLQIAYGIPPSPPSPPPPSPPPASWSVSGTLTQQPDGTISGPVKLTPQ